jgi:hypothetical protein
VFGFEKTSSLQNAVVVTRRYDNTFRAAVFYFDCTNSYNGWADQGVRLINCYAAGDHGLNSGTAVYLKSDTNSTGNPDYMMACQIEVASSGYENALLVALNYMDYINGNTFTLVADNPVNFMKMIYRGSPSEHTCFDANYFNINAQWGKADWDGDTVTGYVFKHCAWNKIRGMVWDIDPGMYGLDMEDTTYENQIYAVCSSTLMRNTGSWPGANVVIGAWD